MENDWFFRLLGVLDGAIDLLLGGAVIVLIVLFTINFADVRGLDALVSALFFGGRR